MTGKTAIRVRLLEERRALNRQSWLAASESILQKAMSMPELVAAAKVHCYVSMEHDREVSTQGILEWLAGERKEVCMPYIERDQMLSLRYLPGHGFMVKPNRPPVPEPLVFSGDECFDAVIVPLVGFDRTGGRIGYGKGWYDRFFEQLFLKGMHPLSIGLAFGFQEVPQVPDDPWDKPLDYVITENEIINCLNSRA
ncbi:MAG: 5-formyltetrahydrofolate cyclo-ligase [Chlorobiaceae bacterium]|jgi:5-formyltetrahydrofolate cyclo-ligase|nr:5-formyltetrahydrofolate cyclo-ligase [Chlorobiaceae bacterium]